MFNLLSPFKTLSKKISNFLTFICCLGPVLVIVGIVFLVSASTHSREKKIAQYNDAVQQWTTSIRTPFSQATFGMTYPTPAQPMVPQTSPSKGMMTVTDSDTSQIQDYTPLFFGAGSAVPFSPNGSYVITTVNANGVAGWFKFDVPPEITKTVSQTTMRCRTSYDCNARTQKTTDYNNCIAKPYCSTVCSGTYGGWLDNSETLCSYYSTLRSICLQVADGGAGVGYKLATATSLTNNKLGCDYSNGFEPATYVPSISAGNPSSLSSFVLRQAGDPYITLQAVTSGTGAFGLSTGQKAGMGAGLLIAGIVWMILLCVVLFLIVRCFKRTVETATGKVSNAVVVPVVNTVPMQEYQPNPYVQQQTPQPQPYPHQQQPYAQQEQQSYPQQQQPYAQQQQQPYPQQQQQPYAQQQQQPYARTNKYAQPYPPTPTNPYYQQPATSCQQPYQPSAPSFAPAPNSYQQNPYMQAQPVDGWPAPTGGAYPSAQGYVGRELEEQNSQDRKDVDPALPVYTTLPRDTQ
ncbi:hypothetical protein HDV00_011290 [Rhizophlyctis rosea]|nr:hypothetical protein HDV00_011290 [Rhizophlyctis rosea]